MAAKPIPTSQVPVIDVKTGLMTLPWYEYFASRDRMTTGDLRDVVLSGLSNGEVLIWNAATSKFEPGAN